MSAIAYLHVFSSVKIFAPGVASVIQDFAAVWGNLVSIFAALYLMVLSILCMDQPMCKGQGNGE